MEQKPDDLRGMNAADGREYIIQHIATLKLTEKAYGEAQAELEKWQKRAELARGKGAEDLAAEAEREEGRIAARRETLAAEIAELRTQIETMRRQLPGLAARERSVDPDLLEQEFKILLGEELGGADEAKKVERKFDDMNADAALEALKAKMGGQSS